MKLFKVIAPILLFLVVLNGCGITMPSTSKEAERSPLPRLDNTKVGDIIIFGMYNQNDDTSNAKDPIEWSVLEVMGGKALLLSNKLLDSKPYDTDWGDGTWATSTLRTWLNTDFIDAAFSAMEVEAISTTTVTTPASPIYGTPGGDATRDKVFLLSIQEAKSYFFTDESRIATGVFSRYDIWWLRSSGPVGFGSTPVVLQDGSIDEVGEFNDWHDYDVRPALWLNLTD